MYYVLLMVYFVEKKPGFGDCQVVGPCHGRPLEGPNGKRQGYVQDKVSIVEIRVGFVKHAIWEY